MTYGSRVLEFSHDEATSGLAMILLVIMTYIAGRVHQFFRQTTEREEAFRDGYHLATRSLFAIATRVAKGMPAEPPKEAAKPVPAMRGYASVPGELRRPLPARHRAPGRRRASAASEIATEKYEDWPHLHHAA